MSDLYQSPFALNPSIPFDLSLSKERTGLMTGLSKSERMGLMFWVYILECADGSYYTGHTDNLEKRMNQYCAGECEGYVAAHSPVKLAWSQECATRYEALSAERQVKGWSRKKKEAMMRADWNEVSRLAQGKTAAVRPELVEGKNTLAVRGELVEPPYLIGSCPSTSSGRTGLLLPEASVNP